MKHRAGELRAQQTKAEARLWARLRANRLAGAKFRRQHAIGRYVVDFCSPHSRLVIELDGSQHLTREASDAERTAFLESMGYRVMRLWNNAVLQDIDGVILAIQRALLDH